MGASEFKVGISKNLFTATGAPSFGDGPLEMLAHAGLHWEIMPADGAELLPRTINQYNALYIAGERLTQASMAGYTGRLAVVARHGIGFDAVDLAALTRHGIPLTNTPVAIRNPVATAALALILSLTLKLPAKTRLVHEGRWRERSDYTGMSLPGRTLGILGLGGVGRELARIMEPFGMHIIGADPFVTQDQVSSLNISKTSFDEVMSRSDIVVVACPLNDDTFHIVNESTLSLMKNSAYLVNIARGPVVDEMSLISALNTGKIAGAGLDVFEQEPVDSRNPLLSMHNVIVTPHALSWTDGFHDGVARSAIRSIIDTFEGRLPAHIVNRDVLKHSRVTLRPDRTPD